MAMLSSTWDQCHSDRNFEGHRNSAPCTALKDKNFTHFCVRDHSMAGLCKLKFGLRESSHRIMVANLK